VTIRSAAVSLNPISALMSRVPDAEPTPNVIDIATIVQRTMNGDTSAFELLIIRYDRRVFSLAMKLLGESDDARDAAQEVFFRTYKYIHRLDLQKPFEPWLMRMTVNVCRDIGRKRQQRRATVSDSEMADSIAHETSNNPHDEMILEEERRMLRQALAGLPETERIAIVLRDIEGLSTLEVATILDSSETTVRSQISRGRVRLKNAIEQMMGGRR
jgi:RNA polymerase sigma-70 factor, ECF subfamily